MATGISPEATAFLRKHIHSVEQLEILLLIYKQQPKVFSASDVYKEIKSNQSSIEEKLYVSLQRELIDLRTETPERQYFYDLGKNAERDLAMAKLAQSYGIYRVKMIEFIYTKRDQISEIADAFVFKKDRS